MTWWQWVLTGVGSYLGVGFIISIIFTRAEAKLFWRDGKRYDDWETGVLMSIGLWPILLAMGVFVGLEWVGKQIHPLAQALYIPAKVRKNPDAHKTERIASGY